MVFKLYNCDVGIKKDGQTYNFTHVVSVAINDPEKNNLTRGANAGNKIGISYREGLREPKTFTIPILDMTSDIKALLDDAYDNQSRLDVFAIDRSTGSGKLARNAILVNKPQQLQLDDSVDSMNVSLEFATFDSTEDFKGDDVA